MFAGIFLLIIGFAIGADSALARVKATLGKQVELHFGKGVKDIECLVSKDGNESKAIIKDGVITEFGKSKFGDRLEYHPGALKIHDLQESDYGSFSYRVGETPMAIIVEAFDKAPEKV